MDRAPLSSGGGGVMVPAEAGSEDAQVASLVLKHLPLVRALAGRLFRLRWDNSVPFDEYCQMGSVGLLEAAHRFDPAHGAQFSTFASWRITGAILNGLEHLTEVHQQRSARRRDRSERIVSLSETTVSGADENTSAAAALARLSEVAVGLAVGFMLEDTGMFCAGDEVTHRDGYAHLATAQLALRLRRAVEALPAPEQAVVRGHYYEHRAFVELAEGMQLSKGRISQLHRRGVELLRAALREEMIGFEG
jgi:RNA polymerase sigma factor FliA